MIAEVTSKCPCCKEKVIYSDFRDNLSLKKNAVTGLCQKCIDGIMEYIKKERANESNRVSN